MLCVGIYRELNENQTKFYLLITKIFYIFSFTIQNKLNNETNKPNPPNQISEK